MNEILTEPLNHPSVWTVADVAESDDWTVTLRPDQILELDRALAAAQDAGKDGYDIARNDFPLPGLSEAIATWVDEIENGRGFLVLRGLPVERYDDTGLYALYWGLGRHFGDAIIQNYEGRRINEVQSRGHSYDEVNIRAYATASHLGFHNDPSDLTCLLCLRQAKSGGLSRVASAGALYNAILAEHPEFLEPLCRGFHHDVRGEGPTGDFNEITDIPILVFSYFANKLSCCLNSKAIATARQKMGDSLTALEQRALDFIESRAMQPDLRFDFMLQPGDLLMMNNYAVLHARTAFDDWDSPARKRLLLRLWLNLHQGRALAPNVTGRFNTGPRGGATVHDHSDADLLAAGR